LNARALYLLAALLSLAGLALFAYKALALHFPLTAETRAEIWNIEARVVLDAGDGPVKATLLIPRDTRYYHILGENFVSPGFGLKAAARRDDNRQAVWSIRQVRGRQVLFYRATLARRERGTTPEDAAITVQPPRLPEPALTAARTLAAEARARSADLDTMVSQLVERLNQPRPDPNVALLLGRQPSPLTRMQAAARVLGAAGIAARVAHGIRLEQERRDAPLLQWLQVHTGDQWRAYDPDTGQPGLSERSHFVWWTGDDPLLRIDGARFVRRTLSVTRSQETALAVAIETSGHALPRLHALSLFSLPIETQAVYRVLLLIPVGALMLVVLRNVVGVKTFGTFMPVLIALAFRETQLAWGIVLFSVVVGLGLGVRFYLDRLKLLLVARLAVVLTVVVLLMAGLSVLSHHLGLQRGLSLALFPMVIMTMTIERMSIVWDERGSAEALLQGAGSLIAAAIAYLVMFRPWLDHLVFVFPELLLLVLAAMLLLGRYTGYRLTELARFRALARGKP
jgi:hypothetical protein